MIAIRNLPVIPTVLVALAVATMIGLGIWQIQRKAEKEALVDRYASTSALPPVAWPEPPDTELLYRRATGFCLEPVDWRSIAGQNREGEAGWQHIASCRTGGGEGPGMQVVVGWSASMEPPEDWEGGEVSGIIALDPEYEIRLVSEDAAPGLQPVARPDPADMPNNHLLYAIQWFFFAGAAALIYVLALRKRMRS
ncbi:MAG: SURF1 family protein [Parasphingopyxis sp.]|uniref:SURF1 family protein n=1 Tax=Parasphingopyxis sp. TaxID=1920299 RepID=UPI0032EF7393